MSKLTQVDMMIDVVNMNGEVTFDDFVKIVRNTGATFDRGLCHARIVEINEKVEHRRKLKGSKLAYYDRTTKYGLETVIVKTRDLKTLKVPPTTRKHKKVKV